MKFIIPFILLVLLTCNTFAQTPEKMSYQAVIRDNNNELVTNSNVNLKIILRQGSPDGYIAYQENHQAKSNKNGLVSLQIGQGNGEVGEFSSIDWSQGPYFIETQLDVKNTQDFSVTGVSEMLSVPYALHAKSADSFTGDGNEAAFAKWDKDITDDFSGNYTDLKNIPSIYTRNQVDSLVVNLDGGGGGTVQSLNLEGEKLTISGGNSISFDNWDTNASDDFSGDYSDLKNTPSLFSGKFTDLTEIPNLYTKNQVDSLVVNLDGGGTVQSLNLEGEKLTISGGNSISFENWDTNASDDFSGNYSDLKNTPSLYTRNQVDSLVVNLDGGGGTVQSLNLEGQKLSISGGNSISFDNWDTNASDDFSGDYTDLKNAPALFSGKFTDLTEIPNLYTKNQVDSLVVNLDGGGGTVQSLNLEGEKLSISGGNSISFENWDTNASDDFNGAYSNLTGTPDLYTKAELYTKTEVDNIVSGIEGGGGSAPQNLSLDANKLSISGGNSISFENWDTNASDDFSGDYSDLKNKPSLFTGDYQDLTNLPEIYTQKEVDGLIKDIKTNGAAAQSLKLEGNKVSISDGNTISFDNWDTNASDDFSGDYSDLKNKPKMYTQAEVDSIKAEILKTAEETYSKKAKIISLSSSRNIISNDIGNTIACKSEAYLTIPSGFSTMQNGDVINLEVHGSVLTIKGASGVSINGSNKSIIKGNNSVYTGGIIRKTGTNSYIVL